MEPNEGIDCRFMHTGEEADVMLLVERVFNEFVAPDFGEEGIREFYKFASRDALTARAGAGQIVVLAEKAGSLLGMIEVRDTSHVALLFVEQRGRGIACRLLSKAAEECTRRRPELTHLTVNSSPYAETFYTKLGFAATGPRQVTNGITHTPMALDLRGFVNEDCKLPG